MAATTFSELARMIEEKWGSTYEDVPTEDETKETQYNTKQGVLILEEDDIIAKLQR